MFVVDRLAPLGPAALQAAVGHLERALRAGAPRARIATATLDAARPRVP